MDHNLLNELKQCMNKYSLSVLERDKLEVLTSITTAAATLFCSGRFSNESDAVDAAILLYNEAQARFEECQKQKPKAVVRHGF